MPAVMGKMNPEPGKFDVTASIDTAGGLKVPSPIELPSPPPNIGSITLSGDGLLECCFKVHAADQDEAFEKAEVFANSLADYLAYFYRTKIKGVSVRQCSSKRTDGVSIHGRASVTADAHLVRFVTPETAAVLSKLIQTQKSPRGEDLLRMYQDAVSEDSTALRYLLLYRILEFCAPDGVDKWILREEPSTKTVSKTRRKRPITIYTDLRDKIHANEPNFPYRAIANRVTELDALVRKALEDKLHGSP